MIERKGTVGQKTGPTEGKEIFRIAVQLEQLRAVFPVAEGFKLGTPVLITIPALQLAPIHASITRMEGQNAIADFQSR